MACEGHEGAVLSFGRVGSFSFASGSDDSTLRVWASDGTLERVLGVNMWVLSICLSPCDRLVAAGCGGGFLHLFRLPDWGLVWSVTVNNDRHAVNSVAWSPSGRFLASGSRDHNVCVLSADTGALLRTLRGHTDWVVSVFFSHDGTKVLSGSLDKTVKVWRIFWEDERRVRGLLGGLEVDEGDWERKEVCCGVVGRMKRLWEVVD
jgi:WD40 repeat protein